MKKIGIMTIVDYSNYGNRLQNYALQEVLLQLGAARVETIRNVPNSRERLVLKARSEPVKSMARSVRDVSFRRAAQQEAQVLATHRKTKMERFSRSRIEESEFVYEQLDNPYALANEYDFFVVGSDQVWSPFYRASGRRDFLQFAERDQRVAYAASFGVANVPRHLERSYAAWLESIPKISVREDAGAELVRSLTGREDVSVVLDPTLLVPDTTWREVACPADELPSTPYALTFFLGRRNRFEQSLLNVWAEDRKAGVLDMSGGTVDGVVLGIEQFVGLIGGASLLLTDSFHATVFATRSGVPAIPFGRKGMDSRISTLGRVTGLGERWSKGIFDQLSTTSEIDWSEVSKRIGIERASSIGVLSSALQLI